MNLSRYTYRQKIRGIWILFGVILFAAYQLSIKKTIGEYRKFRHLSEISTNSSVLAKNSFDLKIRFNTLKTNLSQYNLDTLDLEKNLLAIVSEHCHSHNLVIKEYKPLGIGQVENIRLLNRCIVVEGTFKECLQLIYKLESYEKAGRLASVQFKSYEEKNDGIKKLNCIIYVQNIL